MNLIRKEKDWFLSEDGQKAFEGITSLEDRSIFIYSYLKTFADESFEQNKTLFKLAFLMADFVYGSNTAYSKYPEILKKENNPFIAYLTNAEEFYGDETTYTILTSILYNKANAFNKNEWIYNPKEMETEKLKERGIEFIPTSSDMLDIDIYASDSDIPEMQIALVWIFLKKL